MKDYEVVRQGLIAETDILKRLNHPHLPSIIDVIDREDTFLIVMDYIEGKALDYWLKKEGAQPQERVVEWAKQICDVFGYLHSRKPPIIYRDLKPANVMLKPDGQIMIIDFGTAREFKETNPETALVMYKELVYRIDENALDFKRAGVTKGELLGELEETKKTLETTSFASTNANQTDINEQKKQEILNNISSAKEHVQVAFESRGTGGDADAE